MDLVIKSSHFFRLPWTFPTFIFVVIFRTAKTQLDHSVTRAPEAGLSVFARRRRAAQRYRRKGTDARSQSADSADRVGSRKMSPRGPKVRAAVVARVSPPLITPPTTSHCLPFASRCSHHLSKSDARVPSPGGAHRVMRSPGAGGGVPAPPLPTPVPPDDCGGASTLPAPSFFTLRRLTFTNVLDHHPLLVLHFIRLLVSATARAPASVALDPRMFS